jgi:hypothetical protein
MLHSYRSEPASISDQKFGHIQSQAVGCYVFPHLGVYLFMKTSAVTCLDGTTKTMRTLALTNCEINGRFMTLGSTLVMGTADISTLGSPINVTLPDEHVRIRRLAFGLEEYVRNILHKWLGAKKKRIRAGRHGNVNGWQRTGSGVSWTRALSVPMKPRSSTKTAVNNLFVSQQAFVGLWLAIVKTYAVSRP